jgi:hypothetical protein
VLGLTGEMLQSSAEAGGDGVGLGQSRGSGSSFFLLCSIFDRCLLPRGCPQCSGGGVVLWHPWAMRGAGLGWENGEDQQGNGEAG